MQTVRVATHASNELVTSQLHLSDELVKSLRVRDWLEVNRFMCFVSLRLVEKGPHTRLDKADSNVDRERQPIHCRSFED